MNELEFQEEWLSAYLDDELTDEQRLIVEQRLAIDPAAQATLEDLQRVRAMVSKLPSWSGPDLKFAIPVGVPGSVDEADGDTENDLDEELEDDSELDDFEEVPRLIAGVEEPRVSTATNANRNSSSSGPNSGSTRSLLGWLATAASILLVVGVGYLYWPNSAPQVAQLDSAPSVAAKAAPRLSEQDGKIESNGLEDSGLAINTNGNELSNGAVEFGAPVVAAPAKSEFRDETKFERTDPAPLAKKSEPIPQSDTLALNAIAPSRADSSGVKMKTDLESMPASPSLPPPGAVGGLGGAAAADLAMNNLPADAPAAAELPPPSPLNAPGMEVAGVTNDASAASVAGDKSQRNALPAPAVYYARSQSWQDEETQTTLSWGAQQNRADQLAFGSNMLQQGAEQNRGAVASDSVLMAAIKPEVANSPQFFPNLVNSNRLVEVDQRPTLNQAYAANQSQLPSAATNSAVTGRLESAGNTAPPTTNAPASNTLSNQRFQMAIPNQPQGNSFVLFLNRNEANTILNQLQEKGQVSSQIWRVINQPESQQTLGRELNNSAPVEPQNATGKRVTGEPQKENSESVSSEKVILILNGPPN